MFLRKQLTVNNLLMKEYEFKNELAIAGYLFENEEILSLDEILERFLLLEMR